jgi:hypothetical protein
VSIYHGLNARRGAEKWLAKGAEWANKAHGGKNATVVEPKPAGPEYVTVAEYALVDNLRMISFFACLASVALVRTGKKALRASW